MVFNPGRFPLLLDGRHGSSHYAAPCVMAAWVPLIQTMKHDLVCSFILEVAEGTSTEAGNPAFRCSSLPLSWSHYRLAQYVSPESSEACDNFRAESIP